MPVLSPFETHNFAKDDPEVAGRWPKSLRRYAKLHTGGRVSIPNSVRFAQLLRRLLSSLPDLIRATLRGGERSLQWRIMRHNHGISGKTWPTGNPAANRARPKMWPLRETSASRLGPVRRASVTM